MLKQYKNIKNKIKNKKQNQKKNPTRQNATKYEIYIHSRREKQRLKSENARFICNLHTSFPTTQDYMNSHNCMAWAGPSWPLWVHSTQTINMKGLGFVAWTPDSRLSVSVFWKGSQSAESTDNGHRSPVTDHTEHAKPTSPHSTLP